MEQRIMIARGEASRVKQERFEDDFKREGRQIERVRGVAITFGRDLKSQGLEGGADEELDYDFEEEFQDDEENNTFYRDQEEEDEAKFQEVSKSPLPGIRISDGRNNAKRSSEWPMRLSVISPRSRAGMKMMMEGRSLIRRERSFER